ncbi:hypothetical protein AK812_SmicGene12159 [Symbiodinium microadriaticum]|uniref:Uncharacterized protein n=1 Tax=Symbiodinium microadriaticum TaxID=2951 RepID=A0A1Q9EBD0_SYMMI|nr:hypothetical protein AK812_SmicGene12159 [Symbiodinium microadriaticum]
MSASRASALLLGGAPVWIALQCRYSESVSRQEGLHVFFLQDLLLGARAYLLHSLRRVQAARGDAVIRSSGGARWTWASPGMTEPSLLVGMLQPPSPAPLPRAVNYVLRLQGGSRSAFRPHLEAGDVKNTPSSWGASVSKPSRFLTCPFLAQSPIAAVVRLCPVRAVCPAPEYCLIGFDLDHQRPKKESSRWSTSPRAQTTLNPDRPVNQAPPHLLLLERSLACRARGFARLREEIFLEGTNMYTLYRSCDLDSSSLFVTGYLRRVQSQHLVVQLFLDLALCCGCAVGTSFVAAAPSAIHERDAGCVRQSHGPSFGLGSPNDCLGLCNPSRFVAAASSANRERGAGCVRRDAVIRSSGGHSMRRLQGSSRMAFRPHLEAAGDVKNTSYWEVSGYPGPQARSHRVLDSRGRARGFARLREGTNMYTLYQSYDVDISTLFVTDLSPSAKTLPILAELVLRKDLAVALQVNTQDF